MPDIGWPTLPLTTVAMPLFEIGAAAVDAVLRQLAGSALSDVAVPVLPAVSERASTRRAGSPSGR